jgi:NADPH:quinone reductase
MSLGDRYFSRVLSLSRLARPANCASTGSPRVTLNLVDFYHREARLIGLDTLEMSFVESAEILKALLPGFKAGSLALPAAETISLDGALGAYWKIDEGTSRKKFAIRFE